MNGLAAILIKELAHIRREPTTLFFAFVIPVLQMVIFGYAIRTTVDDIRTVVYDLDGRQESRALVDAFVNSRKFKIVDHVRDQASVDHALSSGAAKVAITIPPDFTERLLRGQQATVQVLIDGSDSQIANTAMNAAALIGLNQSLKRSAAFAETLQTAVARDASGRRALPIEVRPRLLYNPNLESAHFLVPGLLGIIMQLVTLFLTSFAIVRERELGTLEQLFVTPVGRAGLLLGKLIPYAIMGAVETLVAMTVMVYVFGVPINGDLWLLLATSVLFLVTALGLGLLLSTIARTQLQATQFAYIIMLPSVLLSGFMFPREAMPLPIYLVSFLIPVTYFLEILRGIILRAADFRDLLPHIAGLLVCLVVTLGVSLKRFHKQLD